MHSLQSGHLRPQADSRPPNRYRPYNRVPDRTWIAAREALVALWLHQLDLWGWRQPTARERRMLYAKAARLLLDIEARPKRAWRQLVVECSDPEIGFIGALTPTEIIEPA